MKKLYCNYNPNDKKYYCSFNQYGMLYPKKCILILDHSDLFEYIKENYNKYDYVLPFLVANDFERRLALGSDK